MAHQGINLVFSSHQGGDFAAAEPEQPKSVDQSGVHRNRKISGQAFNTINNDYCQSGLLHHDSTAYLHTSATGAGYHQNGNHLSGDNWLFPDLHHGQRFYGNVFATETVLIQDSAPIIPASFSPSSLANEGWGFGTIVGPNVVYRERPNYTAASSLGISAFDGGFHYPDLGNAFANYFATNTIYGYGGDYTEMNNTNALMPMNVFDSTANGVPANMLDDPGHHAVAAANDNMWTPNLAPAMTGMAPPVSSDTANNVVRPDKPRSVCTVCHGTFSRSADLERHMRKHQPNAGKIHRRQIQGCKYSSYRKDKLTGHVKSRHSQNAVQV